MSYIVPWNNVVCDVVHCWTCDVACCWKPLLHYICGNEMDNLVFRGFCSISVHNCTALTTPSYWLYGNQTSNKLATGQCSGWGCAVFLYNDSNAAVTPVIRYMQSPLFVVVCLMDILDVYVTCFEKLLQLLFLASLLKWRGLALRVCWRHFQSSWEARESSTHLSRLKVFAMSTNLWRSCTFSS